MAEVLLYFYGAFLIVCGIASVLLIGPKAKTAVLSGGISGISSMVVGYFMPTQKDLALWIAVVLSGMLFVVFAWRSAKTLFRIFELIPSSSPELRGKGIAFLIISLMAVVSIFVMALLVAGV